jgi:aryl-phospho-beta-D-glucosidase BglC (GH1 family)
MNVMKKLAVGVTALALCVSTMTSGMSSLLQTAAVDDGNDDWLHAVGSRLYDKDGNEVWLTGANWFGFNCSENVAHGLYAADIDEFLSNVADRGINVIRFPISSELLLSWMNGAPNPVSSVQAGYDPPYVDINKDFVLEDGKTVKDSMEIFDIVMQKCKNYGIKAIIDVHSPDANNSGHNYNLWYGKADITTDLWIETLTWLADKYKNDDTIIAYDLKNEPHGKGQEGSAAAKWDGSTDENNWAYAATQCANSILSVNPNALILVEGVEQYLKSGISPEAGVEYYWGMPNSDTDSPYYPAWWGGQLRGVRDYPIVPDSGTSQIVYSPHDYGPSVHDQTWFQKDFTTQTLLDDYWYDTWAYINAEDIAPLLIGEWGGYMDDGDNQKWMTLLREYMIENHINHTFWCLNPNSGDTGGLLGYDFMTWDEDKYGLLEPALWQTSESGLYISLDHERALGVNGTGISLSEYYASYADTEGSNLAAGGKTDPIEITEASTEATTGNTTEGTTANTALLYGDSNDDGTVNILDVIALNKSMMGSYTLTSTGMKVSDVDLDGSISAADSLLIMKYIVKMIAELPV